MKKLGLFLLAGLMSLTLVGCSKDDPAKGDQKVVKVGVAIYQYDDNFMTLYREELQKYLESKSDDKVKYEVTIMDGKNDTNEQTQQIDNFIASKMDVIIANLVQPTAAQVITDKCKEAGIPLVYINREPVEEILKSYPEKSTYVGADARQSGKFQGEIIADLPNKGDINGDGTLSYIMIQGDPENVDAQYRTEFSISQYIEKSGLKVKELDKQRGDWKEERGQEITNTNLAKFGKEIEVVFCNNDGMAKGAITAIEAANRKVGEDIYIVGVDALAECVEMVNGGRMTGTVLNDHIGQSHAAADAAIKAVNGEKLDTYYWVDYQKVTKK